jgi:hypothetical protein
MYIATFSQAMQNAIKCFQYNKIFQFYIYIIKISANLHLIVLNCDIL